MLTNDLKKGDRIGLRNGWMATILDNRKGNTRLCEVEGFCTEMGSVYAHDIMFKVMGTWRQEITHTPEQIKLQAQCEAMGF